MVAGILQGCGVVRWAGLHRMPQRIRVAPELGVDAVALQGGVGDGVEALELEEVLRGVLLGHRDEEVRGAQVVPAECSAVRLQQQRRLCSSSQGIWCKARSMQQ